MIEQEIMIEQKIMMKWQIMIQNQHNNFLTHRK